jgi:hypothetical protein
MTYKEEFKRSEGLAKKVMEILIDDFVKREDWENMINREQYFELIQWSLEDYESCGYNMKQYRTYVEILKIQEERKKKGPGGISKWNSISNN